MMAYRPVPRGPGETQQMSVGIPAAMAPVRVDVAGLTRALREETRLLGQLKDVLLDQREAVARDDLAAVDQSVFDAQRVLLSLSQARRRRKALLVLASGDEDRKLVDLPELLGALMTPELEEALDAVLAAAGGVAREMGTNRQILHGAVMTGNAILQALGGAPKEPVYSGRPVSETGAGQGNLLLNRQV